MPFAIAFPTDWANPATLNNCSHCYTLTKEETIHFELNLSLYEVPLKVILEVRSLQLNNVMVKKKKVENQLF